MFRRQRLQCLPLTLCLCLAVPPLAAHAGDEPETAPAPTAEVDDGSAEDKQGDETSGWFRIDSDALGLQFWAGASHDLGGVSVASDIYLTGSFAELDVGAAFSLGPVAVTPMVGIGVDFETADVTTLIAPQLFTVYDGAAVYAESWIQVFLSDMFADGAQDVAYTRNFVLYKLADSIAVGPQAEVSVRIRDTAMAEAGLMSVPVGGRVNLGYGRRNTLGIFLGYDTRAPGGSDKVAGRFTLLRTW